MFQQLHVIWKAVKKSAIFWFIIIELGIAVVLWRFGFYIAYSPNIDYNWDAIAAIGEWVSILVGIFVAFAVVYFERKLNKDKNDIGESNTLLLKELSEYKNEIDKKLDMLNEQQEKPPTAKKEDDIRKELKQEIFKFVCISMRTKTSKVAENFSIDDKYAWDILVELCRVDGLIMSFGPITANNLDRNTWAKKG